jgi:riboflavin kinase/FMN adenylyltransferase
MMNIGKRPTVSDSGEKRVEIHVFDFAGDLYGKDLVVFLIDRVREEQNFPSIEALKEQLKSDESNCRNILSHNAALVY